MKNENIELRQFVVHKPTGIKGRAIGIWESIDGPTRINIEYIDGFDRVNYTWQPQSECKKQKTKK